MSNSHLSPETNPVWGKVRVDQEFIEYTHEIPVETPASTLPVFLLRGFWASEHDYEAPRQALARLGIEAITMRSPNKVSEKAAALAVMQDIQENTGQPKFNLAPHSWGGTTAAELANDETAASLLNGILFIASACLTGHNWLQMAKRTVIFMGKDVPLITVEQGATDPKKFVLESLSRTLYAIGDPRRTLREGKQAATGNIQDLIQGARNNNIATAALQFKADPYSPPREALAIAHLFEEVRILPGYDHLALQKRSNEVAPTILEMLARLHPVSKVLPLAA